MRSPRKQPDTSIVLPCIPEGVPATPTLLGCIERLRYADHDVSDTKKFLEFVQQVYIESLGTWPFGDPILHPKKWAEKLENTGILNLLEIPHFSRGRVVNKYVKQLMAVLHGQFFWLEELVSIDIELIAFIIGLPSNGKNPTQYLDDKTKEKALIEDMKKTYGTERVSRGIIIKQISDATTRLTKKLMACKVLRKFRKEEVPTEVVVVEAQCENDTMLSWAPYLLNLFLDECKDAQDWGTEFHYSWMVILITLIG